MPVFLKSIKIYLGLEKEDQKAESKKWSESVRDFAFKIKSSPFCQGSIWQNGEFSY